MDNTEDIIHRQLRTDVSEPTTEIAEVVAELEEVEPTDLKATYDQVDNILDEIYSNPPVPDAQVQITFTYEGYRISVEQDGHAKFVKINDS